MINPQFYTILKDVGKSSSESGYTHQVVYPNRSYFEVSRPKLIELLKGYCQLAPQNDGDLDISLAERPSNNIPVIVMLNLVFDNDCGAEPYDNEFIHSFVYNIQQVLINNLDVTVDGRELTCAVLESDLYHDEDGKFKGHIRFQFPYCKLEPFLQKKVVYPNLIKELRNSAVLRKLFYQPIGDWDKIIDLNYLDNPIPMYLSKVRENQPLMYFNNLYRYIDKEDLDNSNSDEFIITPEDDDYEFDPCDHLYIFQSATTNKHVFNMEMGFSYWLPIFLSIDFWHKVVLQRSVNNTPKSVSLYGSPNVYDLSNFGEGEGPIDNLGKMELADIFLSMWNPRRILNETHWIDIGEAYYDADDGEENGLAAWISATKKMLSSLPEMIVPKFLQMGIEEACTAKYYTLKCGRIMIQTLAWHAREDNRKEYDSWHKSWSSKALEKAVVRMTHVSVARALCRIYWLDFICYKNGKKTVWYRFDKHKLKENPGATALIKLATTDFVKRFDSMRVEIAQQMHGQQIGGKERNTGDSAMSKISSLTLKLEDISWLNKVMEASSLFFLQEDLDKLLDDNIEILGLPNGVLVATKTQCFIRPGRPQDYISRSANVPYMKNYNNNHTLVLAMKKWLSQIFPDPALLRHKMKWFASILRGGNPDKHLNMWCGVGDNSKSMLVRLLEAIFGPYCVKMAIAMATGGGRSNPNGPSPALVRLAKTRLCFLEEPDKDMKFKNGLFKLITGGDTFFGRNMRKNGDDIKATPKVVIVCNDPSEIENDKAMRNRLKYYPFLGTWADDAPKTEEEQIKTWTYKNDPMFAEKIPQLATAMLWLMVEYYPLYIAEGVRDVPPIVKKYTDNYWKSVDKYYQFAADKMEPVPESSNSNASSVDMNQVYMAFKIWHKDTFNGAKIPDKERVKKEFVERWGDLNNNGYWTHIRFKETSGMGAGPFFPQQYPLQNGNNQSVMPQPSMQQHSVGNQLPPSMYQQQYGGIQSYGSNNQGLMVGVR